ncbi:helix-turn-helix transcriptional regulator [Sporosarcina sp. ACRSL]|uniref:helix-turn-helix transcriptional regulator n=1 Tax=Sporosarcina sp. ACRSL TaxID=2918215 RepID=UPI00351CEFE1
MRCKLRDRRLSQGLSLRQLATLASVDRGQLSRYENNIVVMGVDTAAKFALLLNCTIDDLYEYEQE